MNLVEVVGGKAAQRKYIESMAHFCIDTLMPRMDTLDITIKLSNLKGVMGYCLETLPWEIEAHGRETGLFIRWVEENDFATKKWTQID